MSKFVVVAGSRPKRAWAGVYVFVAGSRLTKWKLSHTTKLIALCGTTATAVLSMMKLTSQLFLLVRALL